MILLKTFLTDESGNNAIEYGLIAALISTVVVSAVSTVGSNLKTVFNSIGNNL